MVDTTVETASGVVRVIDFMPVAPDGEAEGEHRLVRLVEGVRGRVAMSTQRHDPLRVRRRPGRAAALR